MIFLLPIIFSVFTLSAIVHSKPNEATPTKEGKTNEVPVCFILGGTKYDERDVRTSDGIVIRNHTGPFVSECTYVNLNDTVKEFREKVKKDHLVGDDHKIDDYQLSLWDASDHIKYKYQRPDEALNANVAVEKGDTLKLLAPDENTPEINGNTPGYFLARVVPVFVNAANDKNGVFTGMFQVWHNELSVGIVKGFMKQAVTGEGVNLSDFSLRRLDQNNHVVKTYNHDNTLLNGIPVEHKLAYCNKNLSENDLKEKIEKFNSSQGPSKKEEDPDVKFGVVLSYETNGVHHEVKEVPIRDDTTVGSLKKNYNGVATPAEFHTYELELWDSQNKAPKHKYEKDSDQITDVTLEDGYILKFIPPKNAGGKTQVGRNLLQKVEEHVQKFVGVIKKYLNKAQKFVNEHIVDHVAKSKGDHPANNGS